MTLGAIVCYCISSVLFLFGGRLLIKNYAERGSFFNSLIESWGEPKESLVVILVSMFGSLGFYVWAEHLVSGTVQ